MRRGKRETASRILNGGGKMKGLKQKIYSFFQILRLFWKEMENSLFAWDRRKGLKLLGKNWKNTTFRCCENYYFDCLLLYSCFERMAQKNFFRKKWIKKNYLNLFEILKNGWCPEGFERFEESYKIIFKPINSERNE